METAKEFRDYFASIPDEKWCRGSLRRETDPTICCALGHIGFSSFINGDNFDSVDSTRLIDLFHKYDMSVAEENDKMQFIFDENINRYRTPKENILAALDKIIESGSYN